MRTIAIVGAGPGLGSATARIFGQHGFHVALISRSQENVDRPATGLAENDIPVQGYAADVQDTDALTHALAQAAAAVRHLLPGMTDLGRGAILFVNGSSAVTPNGNVAGT
jgi:NAD(P)-dependent dehydrogenase (short-subunit alcohol dehydrogenase family)